MLVLHFGEDNSTEMMIMIIWDNEILKEVRASI